MAKVTKTIYKRTYKNGDVYKGPIENDLPTLEGEYTFTNGDVYRGEYLGEYPHGKGKIYFKNGNVYNGSVRFGKMHGKGSLDYADGRRFVGRFIRGVRYGFGTIFYPDGDEFEKFEGYYFNDKAFWGTDYLRNGTTYKGFFKNNMREGRGTLTCSDGYTIKGYFDDDKIVMHNKTTINFPNGETYTGTFTTDGHFLNGKYTYSNGEYYDGDWKDGKFHGQGTRKYANGDKYVGGWKNGKRYGKHDYHWANGEVCYGGTYHPDGSSSGTVTRPDGTTYHCRWDKDGKALN